MHLLNTNQQYCSADYCGSGCVSGPCIIGGITTDGTCGLGNVSLFENV
jgi:hypothetical protein